MAQLQDIFDIRRGHKLDRVACDEAPATEGVAFVSRSGKNNGVVGRVIVPEGITPGAVGELTVALGGSVLSTFVQDESFVTAQNVDILAPKRDMGIAEKLWWCAAIHANAEKYGYGRHANRTLPFLEVPDSAPQHIIEMGDEIPNVFGEVWNFTKDIVGELPPLSRWGEFGIDERFAESEPVGERVELPPFSEWKSFRVGDLFTVKRGKSVRMLDLDEGETPVVTAKGQDNGVAMFADIEPNRKGGFISISGDGAGIAHTAVQLEDCYLAGQAMSLEPKDEMSSRALCFIAGMLEQSKFKYSYGRKITADLVRESLISAPQVLNGEPDFDLIERYMGGCAGVPGSTAHALDLTSIFQYQTQAPTPNHRSGCFVVPSALPDLR